MKRKLLAILLVICMTLTVLPVGALAAGFSDTDGHWGESSIDRWAGYGVLNGMGDGTFSPDANMKRGEFAQMMCNLMGYTEKAPNTFNDVSDGDWYADAVLKLVAAGVMNGVGEGKADPEGTVTREQAAVMLCRAFRIDTSNAAGSGFNDAGQIADWAADSVAALYAKGMINGMGDNTFAPKLDINRASVAKLADNMVGEYVTESKTISGEVKGFVVVKAEKAEVKFEDAKVAESIMVSPSSASANVALEGESTASAVVVSAPQAKVEVGKTAAVTGNVAVEAPEAEVSVAGTAGKVEVTAAAQDAAVEVAPDAQVGALEAAAEGSKLSVDGKVDSLTVAGTAKDAKVDVGKTAEVKNLKTEAEGANVAIGGKVDDLNIDEKAQGTTVTTTADATVKNINNEGKDTSVDAAKGTVEKVNVGEKATGTTVKGDAKVENNSSEPVKTGNGQTIDPGKTEDAKTDSTGNGGGGPVGPVIPVDPNPPTPPVDTVDVVPAPIADHSNPQITAGLGTVEVKGERDASATGDTPVYNVTITGTNIKEHTNAAEPGAKGHWVGFGMPIETGDNAPTYKYKVGTTGGALTELTTIPGRTCEVGGKTYNTVYFSEDTEDAFKAAKYTVEQYEAADTGDTLAATYNVTFAVTFAKKDVAVNVEYYAAVINNGTTTEIKLTNQNSSLNGTTAPATINVIDSDKTADVTFTALSTLINNNNIKVPISTSDNTCIEYTAKAGDTVKWYSDKGCADDKEVTASGEKATIKGATIDNNAITIKLYAKVTVNDVDQSGNPSYCIGGVNGTIGSDHTTADETKNVTVKVEYYAAVFDASKSEENPTEIELTVDDSTNNVTGNSSLNGHTVSTTINNVDKNATTTDVTFKPGTLIKDNKIKFPISKSGAEPNVTYVSKEHNIKDGDTIKWYSDKSCANDKEVTVTSENATINGVTIGSGDTITIKLYVKVTINEVAEGGTPSYCVGGVNGNIGSDTTTGGSNL